jgi:protein tyrosine phosphatase (PTP) superfamily phosphohydrolase (DUF442 family)
MDAGMGPVFAFCETAINCTLIYFSIEHERLKAHLAELVNPKVPRI